MTNKYLYVDDNEIEIVESVKKHGSHNQKTHGRKGGGGGSSGPFETLQAFIASEYPDGYQTRGTLFDQRMEQSMSQRPEYGQEFVYEYVNQPNGVNVKLRMDTEAAEMEFRSGNLIKGLDETMVRTPNIKEPIIVYRGITSEASTDPIFEDLAVGDVFQDAGFASTSLDPFVAASAAGINYRFPTAEGVVFRISVPAQSEGIYPNSFIGNLGEFANEVEFLLPRDSRFKVNSIEGRVWDVEVVND
jgi:hypothetical protein